MNKRKIIDKIKQLDNLSQDEKNYLVNIVNYKKQYGLVWEDKPENVEEDLKLKLPILTEIKEKAILNDTENQNNPNHVLIEGDNLHSLTSLTFTHENKIDLIYIDPPYNTGNKDFVYNDRFVDKEDTYKHSKWLSFMNKRLKIAKRLLSDTGIIFISIDDNEIAQLKLLSDEVFGEQNFIGIISWFKKRKGAFLSNKLVSLTEYLLVYKNKNGIKLFGGKTDNTESQPIVKRTNSIKILKFPRNFVKTKLKDGIYTKGKYGKGTTASILLNDITVKKGIIQDEFELEAPFTWTQAFLDAELSNETEILINTKNFQPRALRVNNNSFKAMPSFIDGREFGGTNEDAYELLKEMFKSDRVFNYSKPVNLIKKIINSISYSKKDATILDFFAGSGTTGQAVLELNNEDNGKRKFILCTNNEGNIAEDVCYPRIEKSMNGYTNSKGEKMLSFPKNNLRYFKCDYVERKPSLKNKKELTKLATELLCIKEECYYEITSKINNKKWNRLFTNRQNIFTYVVYDDINIEEAVSNLEEFIKNQEIKPKVKVYVFSNGQYPYTEDFEDILEYIELCALPDVIYKAYLNVLPKISKL